jgi:hypothetical protein
MKLLSQNIPCAPDEDGMLLALCQMKYELFLTVFFSSELHIFILRRNKSQSPLTADHTTHTHITLHQHP